MSGTTYDVIVNLQTQGDLTGVLGSAGAPARNLSNALGSAHAHARALGSAVSDFGSHVDSAIGGVVDRLESMAVGFAKVAAVGAIALIAHDTISLNQELERTRISLAAIFSSQGVVKDMHGGMQLASGLMSKMRADASALPGEFKDLRGIFTSIALPGTQAGLSPNQIEALSAKTMAVAGALNMPFEQAGREMAMLLEGRAGAHNVLGMQLAGLGGNAAKKFNQESMGQRAEFLSKELDKWAPAIDEFSRSFTGVSTTMLDRFREFREQATKPLFDRLTADLGKAVGWIDHNRASINLLASDIGAKLVTAWEFVASKVAWVGGHLDRIRHGIDRLFSEETLHKAERMGAAFLLMQGALAFGPDMFKVGSAAFGMLGGAGKASSAAGGAASMGAGLLEGLFGAGGIAGATASAAVLTVAVLGLWGAFDAATDSSNKYHASVVQSLTSIGASAQQLEASAESAANSIRPLADALGDQLASDAASAMSSVAQLADDVATLAGAANSAAGAVSGLIASLQASVKQGLAPGEGELLGKMGKGVIHDALSHIPGVGSIIGAADMIGGVASLIRAGQVPQANPETTVPDRTADPVFTRFADAVDNVANNTRTPMGGGGGGGGQHIAKVEITVTGNDDPSRVARKTLEVLADLRRNPNASRGAVNWSAMR